MKLFKRIAVSLAALGLLAGMLPTAAFAGSINTGGGVTFTSGAAPEGPYSLTVHKYASPKDGTATPGTPTGEETTVDAAYKAIEGIGFTMWKVSVDAANPGLYPSTYEELEAEVAAGTRTLTQVGAEVLTDAAGEAVFAGIADMGVYLVKETDSTGKVAGATEETTFAAVAPFLVQIPMTKVDGEGWIKDVHVYPKNQYMTPEKSTTEGNPNAAKPGDIVNWVISVPFTPDMSKTLTYIVKDYVDADLLEFVTADVEVRTSPTKYNQATNDDFTAYGTAVAPADYAVADNGTGTLSVTFAESVIQGELATRQKAGDNYVLVFIPTEVTDAAGGLSTSNNAGIEFQNEGDSTSTEEQIPETEQPYIYSGIIRINKLVKENGADKGLAGVEFKVALSEADAKAGKFVKMADGTTDMTATTDANGKAIFKGVPFGSDNVKPEDVTAADDNTTFFLVETKAPTGYNKIQAPIAVTFKYSLVDIGGVEYHSVADEMTIYNTANFELPLTGSTGIVLSTVAGVVLVGAVIFLVMFRKSKQIKNR